MKDIITMIKVDIRRMFTSRLFYIILGTCLVVPILILVMTSMMEGSVSVNPSTGEETIMEGFETVWEGIGTITKTDQTQMSMDLVSMCNINLVYFAILVLITLFISDDFRSGYVKNLFTYRSNRFDYVISKIFIGFLTGTALILIYFIGNLLGGAIAQLSFDMVGFNALNILMCMLSKIFIVLIFISIFVCASVVGKQKTWLSMVISFGVSMLLFTMIPMISPIDSTIMNVILSCVGGIIFSIGLGIVGKIILNKYSIL